MLFFFAEDSCATSEFSDGQVVQLQPLVGHCTLKDGGGWGGISITFIGGLTHDAIIGKLLHKQELYVYFREKSIRLQE